MPKILVSLTDYWSNWLEDLVETKIFGSKSEVVRMALLYYKDNVMKSRSVTRELRDQRLDQ